MKKFTTFILTGLITLIFFSCSDITVPPNEPGVSLELAEFRKSIISDIHYELHFLIPEDQQQPIQAGSIIQFILSHDPVDIPLDFRESPEHLKSIVVNGTPVDIRHENEHIILPANRISTGLNKIEIEFIAGETSLNRNPDYLYTLFVPDRARTAFPLFDQPDLKAVFDLTLEIPDSWEAISNGSLLSTVQNDSTKTLDFAPSDLFSSYLFSFVAGDFEKITRTVNGVEMTLIHRESDADKTARNLDDIFNLHASSLKWLEEYTGIDYPFQKFDFALIPSFQYGGMEHVGAIQYNASSLFLDEDPSESQLLGRASLIAHETAHMWFGDLVTMEWFNDVWTKEVFANFMAAKIVNPNFPDIDHDLNFLLRHHPGAYSVDRSGGANPIHQYLGNLNEAGQMYGPIIYNKAPIMMRQLELLVGEEAFREGLQEYLAEFAFDNATWPDLIRLLDQKTEEDLKTWSDVWVNTPGRPHFSLDDDNVNSRIHQHDPSGADRLWPQKFTLLELTQTGQSVLEISAESEFTDLESGEGSDFIFNENGYGYGLFPASLRNLEYWDLLNDRAKGSELINLYENMLEGTVSPADYFTELQELIQNEENQLLLNRSLNHLETICWNLFSAEDREDYCSELEQVLWDQMLVQTEAGRKRIFFESFRNIAFSEDQLNKIYNIWSGELQVEGLNLSESDFISMAGELAVKGYPQAEKILEEQLDTIKDIDRKRRFEFIIPALSGNQATRDSFFESLKNPENRATESWVLSALGYLHHPLRTDESEKYLLPSLELLEEIQVTGDIFFPSRWLNATLSNYSSDSAVETVRTFLDERPGYNEQLRMKILQSADMLFRSNNIPKK